MITRQDFTAYEGQHLDAVVAVTDEAGAPVALLTNLKAAVWTVADAMGGTPLLSKTKLAGGITLADDGDATLHLLPADTATTLGAGVYFHELAGKDQNDKEYPLCSGLLTVRTSTALEAL